MATKSTVSFKIENNILIGKEAPIDESINIGESILNAFKSKPDFVGQVHAETGEENTFQQMRERSVKCALWLKKIGVQRNDIVLVCTSNCFDVYIPYLASLYIGAIICVGRATDPGLHDIQCCPKVIFTDFNKVTGFVVMTNKNNEFSTKFVLFESGFQEQSRIKSINIILNDDFDEDEVDKFCCTKLESNKNTAVILFSSGSIYSSGSIRKHVTIPHSFFTSPSSQQIPILLPNNTGIWVESLDWNISLLLTVRCILLSVKAVKVYKYIERVDTVDKVNLPDIIRKYKVNWLFAKISTINILIKSNFFKNCDMPSLKQLLISCKIIPLKFILNIAKTLPETSTVAAYCLPETGLIAFYKYDNIKKFFDFYIAKNISLFFADFNTKLPLNADELGYIQCKSSCLTNGYFDPSTNHTQAAIDDKGWFHTNEIGFYSKGKVAILERGTAGQVISYNNLRFSPFPIEIYLKGHPAVEDVAVVPITRKQNNQDLMAVIIKKKKAMVKEKEIIKYAAKLKYHMHLRAGVLFVEKLPRFFTGSFDREKIMDLANRHIESTKL